MSSPPARPTPPWRHPCSTFRSMPCPSSSRIWRSAASRCGRRTMLIPSIDLQGGRIVQLVQGERLAVESTDMDGWIARFTGNSKVQVIDLDGAKGTGANDELVARVCAALPCRVGGGIRTIERAQGTIGLGATKVILGSALFRAGTV